MLIVRRDEIMLLILLLWRTIGFGLWFLVLEISRLEGIKDGLGSMLGCLVVKLEGINGFLRLWQLWLDGFKPVQVERVAGDFNLNKGGLMSLLDGKLSREFVIGFQTWYCLTIAHRPWEFLCFFLALTSFHVQLIQLNLAFLFPKLYPTCFIPFNSIFFVCERIINQPPSPLGGNYHLLAYGWWILLI